MKMQFFTIPPFDPQTATDALNIFLAAHHVVHVERHFVAEGANSAWSICVSYMEGEERPAADKRQQKKVDYRDTLSEPQFAVFAKLRTLRKTLADQEEVPAYALFTNEQLADMVRRRVQSLAGFTDIDSVGQALVEKYGEAFLRIPTPLPDARIFSRDVGMKMSKQGSGSKLAPIVSFGVVIGTTPRRTCGRPTATGTTPVTATTILASAVRAHADVG
jgi:hypothetical protein